jgi:hypothetical protein
VSATFAHAYYFPHGTWVPFGKLLFLAKRNKIYEDCKKEKRKKEKA